MAAQIRRSKAAALVVDQAKIRQRARRGEYGTGREHRRLRRMDQREDHARDRRSAQQQQGQEFRSSRHEPIIP